MFKKSIVLFLLLTLCLTVLILSSAGAEPAGTLTVALGDKTVTYDGTLRSMDAATVTPSNPETLYTGEVTYAYYSDSGCTQPAIPQNAGTYYVQATASGDANYQGAISNTATLTIEKVTLVNVTFDTVSIPSNKVYDGTTSYPATATASWGTNVVPGETLTQNVDYTLNYFVSDANAGISDLLLTIRLLNTPTAANYAVDASHVNALAGTVLIRRAVPQISLEYQAFTYSGRPIAVSPQVTGISETDLPTGAVTVRYNTDFPDFKPLSEPPSTVGLYHVKATIDAHGNYAFANSNISLVQIFPATPTVTLADKTVTYTGNRVSMDDPIVAGVPGGEAPTTSARVSYYTDEARTKWMNSLPIAVGTYYTQAYMDSDVNYTSAYKDATLTITPATPTLTLADKTVAYSGEPVSMDAPIIKGVSASDVPSGAVTLGYFSDAACTAPLSGPPSAAGTYYAKASIAALGNYTAAESAIATLTITPAVPTLTLANKTITYTGTAVSMDAPTAAGVPGGEAPSGAVTYTYYTDAALQQPLSGPPKNAGTYYAVASIAASGNYASATSNTATLAIEKKLLGNLTLDGSTPSSKPYTGSNAYDMYGSAIWDGVISGETLTRQVDFELDFFLESANAGHHALYYTARLLNTGTAANYAVPLEYVNRLYGTGSIVQALPKIKLNDRIAAYTGTPVVLTPQVSGISETDTPTGKITVRYFTDATCDHFLSGLPVAAGVYFAKAYIDPHGNYYAGESAAAAITIIPATPVLTLDNKSVPYTGDWISIGAPAITGVPGGDTPTGPVTYAYYADAALQQPLSELPKEAGIYYAKAAIGHGGSYFPATSNTATLTITPATPTLTLANKNETYSGVPVSINAATFAGVPGGAAPTSAVTYTYYTDAALQQPLSGPPKNAGIYYAVASIAASGNYKAAASNTATLTITPAEPHITLSDKRAVYTGRAILIDPAVVAGLSAADVPTGIVTYAYFLSSSLTREIPAPTKPSTYYVAAYIAADGNYTAAASTVVKLTIAAPADSIGQATAPDGREITFLTGEGTVLHINWQPVYSLLLNQANKPAAFTPNLETGLDGSLTLVLAPQPDTDGKQATRTLNLTPKFIKKLWDKGITAVSVVLPGARLELPLKDLMDLPDFNNAQAYHVVIGPYTSSASPTGAPLPNIEVTVAVLALPKDDTQPVSMLLPGLTLSRTP